MSKAHPPELKNTNNCSIQLNLINTNLKGPKSGHFVTRYMDKKLSLKLNGGRHVIGILRGFDPFMNLVVDEAIEERKDKTKNNIGMVVIRGNSVVLLEALERVQ